VYDWPRVPHPADAGTAASIEAIRSAVAAAGGPEAVFGLFFEPCQERTGRTFPGDFWPGLAALRDELDLPLVAVETATACYRSGRGPFAATALPLVPDLLTWWGGGQTGYIHCASHLFVSTPLTMVSTWDGDELSLIREQFQLRAARRLDLAPAIAALDAAGEAAASRGLIWRGLGLYRVIEAGAAAEAVAAELAARGLRVRVYPRGHLALAPGLDQGEAAGRRLAQAWGEP
jgi:4-aminobutyrate aminotransferase-like enzyme